jgi:hypothetical protein
MPELVELLEAGCPLEKLTIRELEELVLREERARER